MNYKVFTLSLITVLMSIGCSEESIFGGSGGNDTPCTGENCEKPGPVTPCTGDDCEKPVITCEDVCSEDDKTCDGEVLRVCSKDEKGCLVWTDLETCSDGQYCDGTALACTTCQERCGEADKRCESGGIAECTSDEHGCAVWTVTETCESNEHCDESEFKCVLGCTDQCENGQTRCNDMTVESCMKTADGCLDWQVTETCEKGKCWYFRLYV